MSLPSVASVTDDLYDSLFFGGYQAHPALRHCENTAAETMEDRNYAVGDPNAPVTLVQYSNYSCQDCRQAHRVVEALRERFGDSLRIIFRHLMTDPGDPSAQLAAEAAAAAAARGRFWSMHARLLEGQNSSEPGFLTWHAAAVGLNFHSFQRDMDLRAFQRKVAGDSLEARQAGIDRTPTFFVNGRRYEGPVEFTALSRAVEHALSTLRRVHRGYAKTGK